MDAEQHTGMTIAVIDTLPDEGTNLALHVQLCEQRYLQLLTKLDQTDRALTDIIQRFDHSTYTESSSALPCASHMS